MKEFGFASIEKVIISSKVVYIDSWCFFNCQNLTTIEFKESTEFVTIKNYALSDSSIETINISSSKLELDDDWNQGANYLKEIIISPSNKHYIYKDSFLLGKTDS